MEGILMMSDGPEEALYSGAAGMHRNTLKLFENYSGRCRAEYVAALDKFLEGTIAKHSFDDLSLNLLYLESAEWNNISPAYREELLAGVQSVSQVRRVSCYAHLLDSSLPAAGVDDLSFLRC
jgi:hypothetical protein